MLGKNRRKCGIIECIDEDYGTGNDSLVIKGRSLQQLVGNVLCVPLRENAQYYEGWLRHKGKAEAVIKYFAAKNRTEAENTERNVPNLIIAPNQNRGIEMPWQSRFGQLDAELEGICQYAKLGYDIYLDLHNKKMVFEVYEGVDHTVGQSVNNRVEFSPGIGNVSRLKYTQNYFDYYNVGYAGGEGQDEDRLIYAVGNGTGYDRREIFLDCGGAEISDLVATGTAKLAEKQPNICLEADITDSPYVYEKHYDVGDMVTVKYKARNIILDAQITEVTENYTPADGKSIEAVFGNQTPTPMQAFLKSKKEVK